MSLATDSLTKNSRGSLLLFSHHLTLWAPEKSVAMAHGGHGQAEMAKDNPQGLSMETGSPVLPTPLGCTKP